MATKKFKCKVCGYVHEGDKAPEKCPMCQAPQSEFEEIVEEGAAKKGLNTNSNVYTILYAAVMVIVVAFLLVFVSQTLKDRQDANIVNDTKQQILSALNLRDLPDVAGKYDQVIKADALMQKDGQLVEYKGQFNTTYKSEFDKGNLHVFVAEVEGQTKYIIPMNGLGLWGTIWGYIALNEDRSTVYGVYFSHASETPGLGGEIAGLKFQNRFPGKQVVDGNEIGLKVVKYGKAVQGSQYEIDGVTGATITSTGVNTMINKVLSEYIPFLTNVESND
ncbi:MAG: NADH:ubiquinone reductase (Na(+)-transporting) subunit C [Bacteroidaceae bacterium]|jgi:Na+-transporting NADH:ubiquinone oxidoreductase subunit C|nr:NADH:ubiquinone reductase (Na(+)-transporting) subunit C [Bacteroidaceae bacterium]